MNTKTFTIIFTILSILIIKIGHTAPDVIGSGFNYQGELINNGTPANGNFDFEIQAYNYEIGNSPLHTKEFLQIEVVNGLFTIPIVDFGDEHYIGNEIWLSISVKIADSPDYTLLSPRQRVDSVPYAVQAQYISEDGVSDIQQWDENGQSLISPAKVGVGETAPSAQLHVTNNSGQVSLLKVDDTSDTRLVVQADGKTGVGTTGPSDRLHINSAVDENALRVQIDGATKLRVRANGGTSLGANFANVDDNGLYVAGDIKGAINSNGFMKYMLYAQCGNPTSILNQYNGLDNTNIQATASTETGKCTFLFPFVVSNRFFQASAVSTSGTSRVGCNFDTSTRISCTRSKNGIDANGPIMLMVY